MDFDKCIAILEARGQQSQEDQFESRDQEWVPPNPSQNEPSSAVPAVETTGVQLPLINGSGPFTGSISTTEGYKSMDSFFLVQRFKSLQAERIEAYAWFNGELEKIIDANTPNRYPAICSEATQRFAALSESIIRVKDALLQEQEDPELEQEQLNTPECCSAERATKTQLKSRGRAAEAQEIATLMQVVQEGERDKLMLVAAQHLDKLQDRVAALGSVMGGKSTAQQEYLTKRIGEVQGQIAEAMENIQALLGDLRV